MEKIPFNVYLSAILQKIRNEITERYYAKACTKANVDYTNHKLLSLAGRFHK